MQFPQALPLRSSDVSTTDATDLAAAQPERGREYTQIQAGSFRGMLRERSYGAAGLLYEHWSCALRVRCERPRGYVAIAAVRSDSTASWCGVALDSNAVIEAAHSWELTSRAGFELFAFAVEAGRLHRTEAILTRCDPTPQLEGNRVLGRGAASPGAARLLRREVALALASDALLPEARRALEEELIELATRLRRSGDAAGAEPESDSRRRRAVRRVEEFLEAHEREAPSLATLCDVAEVSERTLEYAFREQIGATPIRFLRLRRLNAVRRELLSCDPEAARVTDVAMRCGFWELGRFAAEYRALFGEAPSATLAARRRRTVDEPAVSGEAALQD